MSKSAANIDNMKRYESEELDLLQQEMARRELARRSFRQYLYYVHGEQWHRTRMSDYLAEQVQRFVETDTGNAFDILLISTPPQHGKECADSTPVPTPEGWKRHGDLKPGDYVFSPEGKPIRVLAEIPQPEPASMLVTFSDGAEVKVHPNHEWTVWSRRRGIGHRDEQITIETHTMLEKGLHMGPNGRRGRYMYAVDPNVCIEYEEKDLPCHPYFLGMWLGDGTTTAASITHHPDDKEHIEKIVSLGYEESAVNVHKTTGCVRSYFYGSGYSALKSLNFGHTGGDEKHIPDIYKQSSKEQRLELLAGMIDSDGYVYQKNGRVVISNINKTLIDDFAEVVRSLGWKATISAFEPKTTTSGIVGKHVCYQLSFNPDCVIPTAIPRKKIANITPLKKRRAIVKIEHCNPEPGKCITVEGGVYLVGSHFTPTHNSITITESFPSWYLGKYPKNRVIMASYNDDTAKKFGRKNIEKVEQFGLRLFGLEKGSIWTTNEFELSNGWGRVISRGILSGITGNPANLIIIDDPLKNRAEADSETTRTKIWEEWQNTLKTRLAAGGKVIVIMTPWHEADISAQILQYEQNVTHIRLPVEAEEKDLLGRGVGDALCPELGKDNEWLKQFKASFLSDPTNGGLRAWQALFQCSPRVEGGNLVQRSWWRYYDRQELVNFGTTVISVDAAFKDAESNDFVAIQVWSKLGNNYYLRYGVNKHLDFVNTLQTIRMMKKLFPETMYIVIEDKANGSAIIQVLRKEFVGVIAVTPKGGKVSRVQSVAPAIESGNVYLPRGELFAEELVQQFCDFPAGKHDDMCFVAGTQIATPFGNRSIESLQPGDMVLTPFGVDYVEDSFCTGEKEVIERFGLFATPNHPFFTYSGNKFDEFKSLTASINCSIISLKEMMLWKYRRLLFLMELNIDSWEPEDIISANPGLMKVEDMRKDFMSRCGSFILGKKYLRVTKFITKTATLLITTSVIWSVYRAANMLRSLKILTARSRKGTLKKYGLSRQSGTNQKTGETGTYNTQKTSILGYEKKSNTTVSFAESLSFHLILTLNSVLTSVLLNMTTKTRALKSRGSAKFAEKSSRRSLGLGTEMGLTRAVEYVERYKKGPSRGKNPETIESVRSYLPFAQSAEESSSTKSITTTTTGEMFVAHDPARVNTDGVKREKVYNLRIKKSHLYYAGGFLVHNCDACSQALGYMLYSNGIAGIPDSDYEAERKAMYASEQEKYLNGTIYDVYGSSENNLY